MSSIENKPIQDILREVTKSETKNLSILVEELASKIDDRLLDSSFFDFPYADMLKHVLNLIADRIDEQSVVEVTVPPQKNTSHESAGPIVTMDDKRGLPRPFAKDKKLIYFGDVVEDSAGVLGEVYCIAMYDDGRMQIGARPNRINYLDACLWYDCDRVKHHEKLKKRTLKDIQKDAKSCKKEDIGKYIEEAYCLGFEREEK